MRLLLRLLLPLLPAWVAGLWLLLASAGVWDPKALDPDIHGDSMAAGWLVLCALVVGSVLYLGAPFFGRKLAVSSSSSSTVGLGEPNAAQRAFGAGFVRVGVVLGLYLLLGSLLLHFG